MKHYSEEEFLKQLLSIPSVNGVDDEREIANFIAEYLKDCKVNVSVREIDQRHANVVAVLGGKSKEKVVWNGHLDTVPYGKLSQWNTDPAVPAKKNGCIYARGASDMKSGLADTLPELSSAVSSSLCSKKKKTRKRRLPD